MKTQDKVKVLFIAGNGRSGSTILDVVVGQLDGFFAVGELRRIWDRGLIENRPCGCGEAFQACETWQTIFEEAYGGMDQVDANRLVEYREAMTQTKHLPGMWLGKKRNLHRQTDLNDFLSQLDPLYRSIKSVTGCDVVVDASKWPMYAYMLDLLPSVELYVLHLVRDPRAVAFSWTRKKLYEADRYLPKQGALKSTFYWVTWNPSIVRFWKQREARYLFFPYEQFVERPQESLNRIVAFVEEAPRTLPFTDSHTLTVHQTHAVAGNKSRLERGAITLRLDDEWKRKLPLNRKVLVSALTWPWLFKYGYSLPV